MNKSDDVGELASALSKLQGEIKDAIKDTAAHKYKYADLSQVLEISRPLLSKYELCVAQLPGSANDKITVDTILMHKSGQWVSSVTEMPSIQFPGMNAAQSIGAVITYARRYALAAIVGITQTDSDVAEAVVERTPQKNYQQKVAHQPVALNPFAPTQVNEIRELIRITDSEEDHFISFMRGRGIEPIGAVKLENFPDYCFEQMKEVLEFKKSKMEERVKNHEREIVTQ